MPAPVEFLLLVAAGVGAGLAGSMAGLASLVSYPALLATGLNPVVANVTNTVALVFSSVGSVSSSGHELTGQRARLLRLAPSAIAGGVAGGALLLLTPPDTFQRFVPVLIGLASIGVVIPRPAPKAIRPERDPRWLLVAMFGIGVYAGYFGAAAGVLLLALLLVGTPDTVPQANAIKNVLLGLANGIAALGFVLFGHVHWLAAVPLALGLFAGGAAGPRIVRRLPAQPLRWVIAVAGLGLAVKLGVDAY